MKKTTHAKPMAALNKGKIQHVLLVEDDKDIRDYMGRILEIGGYRVTGAENGVVALQFLLGAPVDLVITDIQMPHMDGVDLTQRMARHFPHIPVIVMSGAKFATTLKQASNVKKMLSKPIPLDTFISAVIEVFSQPQTKQRK